MLRKDTASAVCSIPHSLTHTFSRVPLPGRPLILSPLFFLLLLVSFFPSLSFLVSSADRRCCRCCNLRRLLVLLVPSCTYSALTNHRRRRASSLSLLLFPLTLHWRHAATHILRSVRMS